MVVFSRCLNTLVDRGVGNSTRLTLSCERRAPLIFTLDVYLIGLIFYTPMAINLSREGTSESRTKVMA